jgi:hypothetical protein
LSKAEDIIKVITRWRLDPIIFIRECFDWDDRQLTQQQIELFTWVGKLVSAKIKVNTGAKTTDAEKKLARKLGISVIRS